MSGGTVIVYGPTNSGNGAIDYDGTFDITGGTLIAIGSSGMAMSPSNTSSQTSLMYNVSNGKAGSEIVLKNASGKEIIKVTSEKQFSNVVISTPELSEEETYSLTIDGVEASITTGNQGLGGRMNGQMGEPFFQDDFSMREIPDFNNEFESGNMQNFEGKKMRGERRWNNQF